MGATEEVLIRLSSEDNITPGAKKGQASLKDTERAADSLGKELGGVRDAADNVAKTLISWEIAKAVAGAALGSLAENSKRLRGEMDGVSKSVGDVVGQFGDALAQSRSFLTVVDTLELGLGDLGKSITANGDAIDEVFSGAVRAAIPPIQALIMSGKGWIELMLTGRAVVVGAWKETTSLVEGSIASIETMLTGPVAKLIGYGLGVNISDEDIAPLRAESARRALAAFAEGEGALQAELQDVELQISKIEDGAKAVNDLLNSIDQKLATGQGLSTRQARVAGGSAASAAASGSVGEAGVPFGGMDLGLSLDGEKGRQKGPWGLNGEGSGFGGPNAGDALQLSTIGARLEAEQEAMNLQKEIYAEQEQLQRQHMQNMAEDQKSEEKRLKKAEESWSKFAQATGMAMNVVIAGMGAFEASEDHMAQALQITTAIKSGVNAAYEGASAVAAFARYDYWAGAQHTLAAAEFALIAGSNIRQFHNGEGLSKPDTVSVAGAPSSPSSYAPRQIEGKAEAQTVIHIHQNIGGYLIRESEADRAAMDGLRRARRLTSGRS